MRSATYEDQALGVISEKCWGGYGLSVDAYIETVKARLAVGAMRYGDDDFLHKNVLIEALEETPDVTAYVLLQLQKMRVGIPALAVSPTSTPEHHLLKAAVHAAISDWHIRQAIRMGQL